MQELKEPEFRHLDWSEILRQIQSFATSGSAKIALGQMQKLSSAEEALGHVENVFDAVEVLNLGTRPFMESLDLFEPWFSRLKRHAVLKPLEVKDVRSFCFEVVALTEVLKNINNNWAKNISGAIMKAEEPLSAIEQILTPRGEIRSDASETLYRLFHEKEQLGKYVQSQLDKLVKDHDMQNYLQDRFVTTREGRWVLPIRSGHQHSVNGVIHGSSQTKQTVFMEPELIIPTNNRLREIDVEIEDEIERLLIDLSNYLMTKISDFTLSREIMEDADKILSIARWTILIEGQKFNFSEDEIFLVDVRHPLMQISAKKPVANSVQLTSDQSVLLLSGPNAGGKTVLLKSIGLSAQMARCGLPICSGQGSRLPFFEKLLVGIGDHQSVDEELSSFAAHIKVLNEAANFKNFNNLILIDEICGSTDPEEGAALARSFIERYSKNNAFAVITSHLGPLKSGWKSSDHVMSGSLEYDTKSGRPTYQFLPGVPGDSLAIQTAKRVGVDKGILDRAIELLSPTTKTRLAGLEEIDKLKSDIHTFQDHLKKETAKAKFNQDKYEKLMANFEKEKDELLQKTIRQAERKIEDLLSQTKVEQTFKKHASLQEIKNTLPEIVKARPAAASDQKTIQNAEDFAKKFPPGTKVFVPTLNQDGIVQSTPNSKGELLVLSNSIRLSLPWHELKPPQGAQNLTANLVRRSSQFSIALTDHEKTIDLRGLTVEEALSQLETELDQSSTQKEDRIKIIHGHGTEALKKAVRTYLSRSLYVKKWKAGSPEQGGDGVTWAELGES